MQQLKVLISTISFFCAALAFSQGFENEKAKLEEISHLLEQRKYPKAEALLLEISDKIQTAGDDELKAKLYVLWHDVKWENSEFDTAFSLITSAINLYQQVGDYVESGSALRERSLDYLISGFYDKAIEDSQTAIDIFQAEGDTLKWAKTLSGLSNINHDIEEYQLGISYGLDALNLLNQYSRHDPDAKAYAINCIAINHDDNGEHQRAIDYHMQIISFIDELKESNRPRTYNNIGNSLMKLGRFGEAIGWLKKNLEINEKIGRKYGLATVKTNLGTLSYLNGEYLSAKNYLDEAEAISYEINDVEKIHDVLYQQYMLYKTWGKFDQSLAYMEDFHYFKDSLLNEKKTRQLAELQTKYETEKKEQQIALQTAAISEHKAQNQRNITAIVSLAFVIVLLVIIALLNRNRSQKKQQLLLKEAETILREAQIEAALNSQESERKRFARDLHDGFGQMISVLNLNLKSLEKDDADRQAIFENSSEVLDEMYREIKSICFNLMPETLIKNGLIDAVKEFAIRINQSNKVHVEVDTFGMEERLSDLQEISLYRITQEWINNILKYSDADHITLSLTRDEEEITLLIEDNGSGFDKTLLTQSKGNGWKNLNSRTNLIKGELELDTTPEHKGNTLILNAPAILITQKQEEIRL